MSFKVRISIVWYRSTVEVVTVCVVVVVETEFEAVVVVTLGSVDSELDVVTLVGDKVVVVVAVVGMVVERVNEQAVNKASKGMKISKRMRRIMRYLQKWALPLYQSPYKKGRTEFFPS
jgi:hypothetical protein